MGKMTVAGVYGQAMFDVARDGDILETVREELNDLQEIFSKETDFFQLLTAEAVSKKEKLQWIEEIFKDKISEKTLSFLCVLIEKEDSQLLQPL